MLLTGIAFFVVVVSTALVYLGALWTSRLEARLLLVLALAGACLYASVLAVGPLNAVLGSLVVLVVGTLVGSCLGLLLTTRAALVSFIVVAAIADVVSSTSGVTERLSQAHRQGTSHLLQALCVSVPVDGRLRPIVGIGDLVILGATYFALTRLGLRATPAFLAPLAGLLVALVVGLRVGGVFAIPFIAVGTLALLWFEARRRSRESLGTGE